MNEQVVEVDDFPTASHAPGEQQPVERSRLGWFESWRLVRMFRRLKVARVQLSRAQQRIEQLEMENEYLGKVVAHHEQWLAASVSVATGLINATRVK